MFGRFVRDVEQMRAWVVDEQGCMAAIHRLFPACLTPTPRWYSNLRWIAELRNNINNLMSLCLDVRPACSQPVSRPSRQRQPELAMCQRSADGQIAGTECS